MSSISTNMNTDSQKMSPSTESTNSFAVLPDLVLENICGYIASLGEYYSYLGLGNCKLTSKAFYDPNSLPDSRMKTIFKNSLIPKNAIFTDDQLLKDCRNFLFISDYENAVTSAEKIQAPYKKSLAFYNIFKRFLSIDNINHQAFDLMKFYNIEFSEKNLKDLITNKISNRYYYAKALIHLATKFKSPDYLSEAKKLAIGDSRLNDTLIAYVAYTYALLGYFDSAKDCLKFITNNYRRPPDYKENLSQYIASKKNVSSSNVVYKKEDKKNLEKVQIDHDFLSLKEIKSDCILAKKCSDYTEFQMSLFNAEESIYHLENIFHKVDGLIHVANTYYDIGNKSEALRVLKDAKNWLEKQSSIDVSKHLRSLLSALMSFDKKTYWDCSKAKNVQMKFLSSNETSWNIQMKFTHAEEMVWSIQNIDHKIDFLIYLSNIYYDLGNKTEALRILNNTRQWLENQSNVDISKHLRSIVKTLIHIKENPIAIDILDQLSALTNVSDKDLVENAKLYIELQQLDKAQITLNKLHRPEHVFDLFGSILIVPRNNFSTEQNTAFLTLIENLWDQCRKSSGWNVYFLQDENFETICKEYIKLGRPEETLRIAKKKSCSPPRILLAENCPKGSKESLDYLIEEEKENWSRLLSNDWDVFDCSRKLIKIAIAYKKYGFSDQALDLLRKLELYLFHQGNSCFEVDYYIIPYIIKAYTSLESVADLYRIEEKIIDRHFNHFIIRNYKTDSDKPYADPLKVLQYLFIKEDK